jgi:hypothetical protein
MALGGKHSLPGFEKSLIKLALRRVILRQLPLLEADCVCRSRSRRRSPCHGIR